jgi:DNA-binding NarL/FixJ family response regulator
MSAVIHRALIVEDEPDVREATIRALVSRSFWCDAAADGTEALAWLQKNSYDLVVTDLRMPNRHGHSLILEMLQEDAPPHIVVLTGVISEGLFQDLRGRGVQYIFQKPVDFRTFAAQMQAICENQAWTDDAVRSDSYQGLQIIKEIERSLELFSLCISPELDAALSEGIPLLEEPAPAVMEFMQRLWNKHSVVEERRKTQRISLLSPAVAVPVTKDMEILGPAFSTVFCDLSPSGACLMNTRSVSAQYLALKWRSTISPRNYLKLAMQVTRCKPLGPFYEVAGCFVMHDEA